MVSVPVVIFSDCSFMSGATFSIAFLMMSAGLAFGETEIGVTVTPAGSGAGPTLAASCDGRLGTPAAASAVFGLAAAVAAS